MKTTRLSHILLLSMLFCFCSEQKKNKPISQDITGDWRFTYDNFTYHARFHPNGLFAYRTNGTFTVSNDTLRHLHVKYARHVGQGNSLIGAWRQDYPTDSTSFIAYLNADNSYYYYWTHDGSNGGGYYVVDGNKLSIVETYGYFYCENDSLFQIDLNGNKIAAKYLIQDTIMTVTSAIRTDIYYRDPAYPVRPENKSLQKSKEKRSKMVLSPDYLK